MAAIDPYLKVMLERGASKLVLVPGRKPTLSVNGAPSELGQSIPGGQIKAVVLQIMPPGVQGVFRRGDKVTFDYSSEGVLFSVVTQTVGEGAQVAFQCRQNTPAVESVPLSEPTPQPAAPAAPPAPSPSDHTQRAIDVYLRTMVQRKASDLHLCSQRSPVYRIDGDLQADSAHPPFEEHALRDILLGPLEQKYHDEFEEQGSTDFAYEIPGVGRYRFNIYKDYRGLSASVRLIPSEILSAEALNLPPAIRALAGLPKGFVVVTGPTGSGKSTTLAAIIDLVNRQRADHILTVEAPIEFVHPDKKCLIHQREVSVHTRSFKDSLRDALREDPDVVLVGEMRDLETIGTAIETASTGHLVFGTLHTTTATSTVNRIIEMFPHEQQSQIRHMLAESLKAVVAQNLLKKKGGGRVAAQEVLIITPSVANLIRENKAHQLLNVMQTGKSLGMQLLNDELVRLVKDDLVEAEEAYAKAVDKDEILRAFQSNGISFTPPPEFGRTPAGG